MREMIDEDLRVPRGGGEFWSKVHSERHTEVRDEGDQFDRQRQDQQGRRDRHPGQQRGDEGHVVYAIAPHCRAKRHQPQDQSTGIGIVVVGTRNERDQGRVEIR
ncbi:hypothetical protein Sjap_018756 [Stephania japonica]|uniref:Uncharacterized protein n=1 Tax=Stephania japonica TaxID=461633 RepID=A0AAP0NNJ7_9MAGN